MMARASATFPSESSTVTESPSRLRFSWSGVPSTETEPRLMIASLSARRSASSR